VPAIRFSGVPVRFRPFMARSFVLLASAVLTLAGSSVCAAAPLLCLSPEERRAAIAGRQAVPLARAVSSVRRSVPGEVVRAQLCRNGGALVYMLTVLSRNGRVTRATLDAANARLLERR
jgi:hypothetical protein